MKGMGIPARTPGITHHSKLKFWLALIWRGTSKRTLDVSVVGFFLNQDGHGVRCRLFVSECLCLRLTGRTDAAPASGHGIAGLGYFPKLARVAFDKLEVARRAG